MPGSFASDFFRFIASFNKLFGFFIKYRFPSTQINLTSGSERELGKVGFMSWVVGLTETLNKELEGVSLIECICWLAFVGSVALKFSDIKQ